MLVCDLWPKLVDTVDDSGDAAAPHEDEAAIDALLEGLLEYRAPRQFETDSHVRFFLLQQLLRKPQVLFVNQLSRGLNGRDSKTSLFQNLGAYLRERKLSGDPVTFIFVEDEERSRVALEKGLAGAGGAGEVVASDPGGFMAAGAGVRDGFEGSMRVETVVIEDWARGSAAASIDAEEASA